MATIKSLSEFILRRAAGGDVMKDFQTKRQEVEWAIFRTLNRLLKLDYFDSLTTPDDEHGWSAQFIFSFKTIAKDDTDRNESYLDIPYAYTDLPNGKGILEIRLAKNPKKALIPIPANSLSLIADLPCGNMEGNKGFYPEGNRVYLVGCEKAGSVIVKLALATGDNLMIDPAMERAIIDELLPMFMKENAQDRINNENKIPQ